MQLGGAAQIGRFMSRLRPLAFRGNLSMSLRRYNLFLGAIKRPYSRRCKNCGNARHPKPAIGTCRSGGCGCTCISPSSVRGQSCLEMKVVFTVMRFYGDGCEAVSIAGCVGRGFLCQIRDSDQNCDDRPQFLQSLAGLLLDKFLQNGNYHILNYLYMVFCHFD